MKAKKILLRNMDEKDRRIFSLWLRDVDVVKFLINMFKSSRGSGNVLNIPFGKNRKVFILQTNGGNNIGFCGLYNIDWQLKKCSMFIYLDNDKNINDDIMHDIINSIVKRISLTKRLKIIEVHTKENRFVKYINNINDVKKCDNEFVFEIGLGDKIS
ncbi:hypothetical protein [Thermoanaerobacterium sp. RBIITD]|uniref:hypothetical protein n=1 Tax=Thermoanaerobacterium sp. RBIITD TaxID=1550240 RepID=UPI000BB7095B|nr:hypothetical protein [Thermoanaerobacterium sp. RBIITD]SNX55061.1 hypothetical protein SAMN05660242_2847 [Thermoanaerobacterium sp. RBIITD]